MKKLIALVLILALPTMAFGAAGYSVIQNGGGAALAILQGSQDTVVLDVILTQNQEAGWGFGGALVGPGALTITSRAYGAPTNALNWLPNNPDATILGSTLASLVDFGSVQTAAGNDLLVGATTVVTLTLSGTASLAAGVYPIVVGDSLDLPPSGGGGVDNNRGWWAPASLGGMAQSTDATTAFTLTVLPIPEPATMLLLALALPFLRRRSA